MPDPVPVSQFETVDADPSPEVTPGESAPTAEGIPSRLGRYRVVGKLGAGGFGVVYKGYDDELQREVAIKVPHRYRISSSESIEQYLTEARILASLDHPGIVPVHDLGRTEDGLCFVVSKFIEGHDLRHWMKLAQPALAATVQIVACVAEALHHAHQRGLVHRDVKPGNILLDAADRAYVADFGLALREGDFGKRRSAVGTPGYMSPEQARGEGHLVDARSDVYSLGVVFYEMLVGRAPFVGENTDEILLYTQTHEPRPPRQLNGAVPREVDRICLKALAKRASDRYSTAADFADDLRHWQAEQAAAPQIPTSAQASTATGAAQPISSLPRSASRSLDRPLKILPRGLRSFNAADADFFLELLPGPRDRDGLPESIRFWKSCLEQTDPDQTFRVGLLYGPSGCGKSSLVKAGLLPRIAPNVTSVYVEATPADTELRLLRGIRKRCPELPEHENLIETIARLRRAHGQPAGRKVVLVLDQFEQWLHARRVDPQAELVQALRQCDGQHVQAIVMVRDDFWMAATRFLRELEIRLVEGQNSSAVDLFDTRHARRVLAAFGRAFVTLPEGQLTPEHELFLDQAVTGLGQEGKVISVRLSLFAEMVKDKPWTPATLRAVGGTEGIGVTFLEETFAASTAPPEHRLHQKAARAVLQVLLPEPGTAIKGHLRSRAELLAASGYAQRLEDFENLMRILDTELRLVTPGDPEGLEDPALTVPAPGQRYYQLAHDYLVQPLRDWLTRKQRETWRGRAQLRLQERAALWSPSRQSRFLPTLPEFLVQWAGVPRDKQKPDERALLRAAARRHGVIWGGILAMLLVGALGLERYVSSVHRATDQRAAEISVGRVINASPSEVHAAIEALQPVADLARPLLRSQFESSAPDSIQKLHAAFALASLSEVEEDFLIDRIATAPAPEAENLITALSFPARRDSAQAKLRQRVQAESNSIPRARLAITLLLLGDPHGAETVLDYQPDPKYRTAFIHAFPEWHGELQPLAGMLERTSNSAFRSGMCAAVGLVNPSSLGPDERSRLEQVLAQLHRDAPDGGTHSAAGWALRKWDARLPKLEAARDPPPGREWFVTGSGITMVRAPAGDFIMGDRELPIQTPHQVSIPNDFFVSDTEISVALFQAFVDDPAEAPTPDTREWTRLRKEDGLSEDCAAGLVLWEEALRFCNWLSRREGREPCYQRVSDSQPKNQDARAGWVWQRRANGFRMLTDEEWECACRAGTTTAFSFGQDPQRLPDYALFIVNSGRPSPGRIKLPNAWGLFDMHGNMYEWCWRVSRQPAAGAVPSHTARGGYYMDIDSLVLRSGSPGVQSPPEVRFLQAGFRVAVGAAAEVAPVRQAGDAKKP